MQTRSAVMAPAILGASCVLALLLTGCASHAPGDDGTRLDADSIHSSAAPAPSPEQVQAGWDALHAKRAKLASRGPKPFDQPDLAAKDFMDQRLAAGATELPMEHLRREQMRLRQREAQLAVSLGEREPPGDITRWTWAGPGNIGGRTRALVIDPGNPDVMYAGGVAGGVWKTIDGGAHWNATDDFMLNLAVVSLAMDPDDSDVIYAGTGEGVFPNNAFMQGLGIFKTVDGGANWNQLPGTVNGVPNGAFHYVNKVLVSPNDSDRIYAATRTGVWRSSDAGATWTVSLANPFYLSAPYTSQGSTVGATDLVIRTDTDPDMLFAAFGNAQADGLFRSFDGGNTWETYSVPSNQGRTTIALAPSDQDIMYLLMADNGTGGAFGSILDVYRSDDGGDSFTSQLDFDHQFSPWLLSNLILATGCLEGDTYSQGWYDNIIAVDPVDPDTVWVGGVDMFRSDDGGQTFGIPAYWIFYTVFPPPPYQMHPDQHVIVFHPDYDGVANQTMYVGNDGGLFRTQNARAATSLEDCPLPGTLPPPEVVWERLNNGYGVTQFYHGDSAKERDMYVAGAQDNGTNRVLSQHTPDDWDLVFGGDGGYVAIDPRDSDVLFIEYQFLGNIQKSVDGGETFEPANNGLADTDGTFIPPIAMDQNDPDVVWTGGGRPWRTKNSAGVWTPVGPNFSGPGNITAIAIAPSDGNVVYMGFDNGYVIRSTNALAILPTWEVLADDLYGAWVSSMAVDPVDTDVVYLTYSNYGVPHVLKSVDGGDGWFSIDGIAFAGIPDIPVHWIEVRPCDRNQLYAGTELGVFVSEDAGATWQPANKGMSHALVESLDFQDENTLAAFSFGRGLFLATLQPCDGVQPETGRPVKKPPPP